MRMPSLNALRAFECAARHQSFSRAANELCVTEGAVSRHVKLLEEELGVALFRRLTRKVELTEEGKELLPVLGQAFASIAAGAARVSALQTDLNVACDQTLAIRWLIPRLEKFRQKHPEIGLRLTARYVDDEEFERGEFDLRLGSCGVPPNCIATRIMSCDLTPACSPRLLANPARTMALDDLAGYTLLHSTIDQRDWKSWAESYAKKVLQSSRSQIFSSLDAAIQVAVLGEGIVMGDLNFMQGELSKGQLVLPFPHLVLRDEKDYYFFMKPEERVSDKRIMAFESWLVKEAEATPESNI